MLDTTPSHSRQPHLLEASSFPAKMPIPEPVRNLKNQLGQLCVDSGANGMRFLYRDTLLRTFQRKGEPIVTPTASCTKSLAAIAIFKLKEMGRLDIDQPLSELLGDQKIFTREHYTQITPRHLLTHTSGLPGNDYFMPRDKSRRIPGDAQFLNHLAPLFDRNTRAAMHPPMYPPGSRYDYSNPGSQILEAVAARALTRSGDQRTVSEFIQSEILTPLGMKDTSISVEGGVTLFNGGMFSSAADLIQLGRLIMNRGIVNGHHILSPSSISEMVSTPQNIPNADDAYGHLWWKLNNVKGFLAVGDLANLVLILPEHNIIVTRTQPIPSVPEAFSKPLTNGTPPSRWVPFSLRVALAQESLFWEGLRVCIHKFVAANAAEHGH